MSSRSTNNRPVAKPGSRSHMSRETGGHGHHGHKKTGTGRGTGVSESKAAGHTSKSTQPAVASKAPVKVVVTEPEEVKEEDVPPTTTSSDYRDSDRGSDMEDERATLEGRDGEETGISERRSPHQEYTIPPVTDSRPRERVQPKNITDFNVKMTDLLDELDNPKFHKVDEAFPIDELTDVVHSISGSVNEYRSQSIDTQSQMEELRDVMKKIRENLHFSVTRQAMDLRDDDSIQSEEERDLHVKLTRLNADIAQANAFLSEALRLAADTEGTAVRANIAAEKAKAETERVQREIETRRTVEEQRKREEKRRMEEQKRQKEEQERKTQEEKRRKAEEWEAKEAAALERSANVYDKWPATTYERVTENGETEITCIARGQPGVFEKSHVTCEVAIDKEPEIRYLPNEELISNIIELKSVNEEETHLKAAIFVAIPHVLSRSSGQSREPVVKAMLEGQWRDLPTKDVTFDTHKDTKFAQAEIKHLTTLVVMSRLKRDYVTLSPRQNHTVTSSFDHRVTMNIDRNTFNDREHFLLQVQPVDSNSIQEFRNREPNGKTLLNSSHIVHTAWESRVFNNPVKVTLSCPPNPAIAKKMALARKIKEEKMKAPVKQPPMTMGEIEKEREKERKRMQDFEQAEGGGERKTVTKWYMGQYANTEDDENDELHFLQCVGGKWSLESDKRIKQVKVDVITFDLERPIEKMMVIRTRPNTPEDTVLALTAALNEFLTKRFVEAVVRQRTDDPFEVCLQVTPISRIDAVVKQLADSGFVSGPAPSHVISLHEGDVIELGFGGNIECIQDVPAFLIYKSNVPTMEHGIVRNFSDPLRPVLWSCATADGILTNTDKAAILHKLEEITPDLNKTATIQTHFRVKEENRYRQKDQDIFSGLLVLTRRYISKNSKKKRDEDVPEEICRERMCALQINIPKHHLEPTSEPKKAPVPITTSGPLNLNFLQMLSEEMGDEWKLVAHYLGLHRPRVQAIIRNQMIADKSDTEAKYEMLLTWLKRASRATDKVSALSMALRNSERHDLADTVIAMGREVKGHTTYVN